MNSSILWNFQICISLILRNALKTAIFSLMSLSGLIIIFESQGTSFCWYQLSIIEYFLSIASLFKIVGIRFTFFQVYPYLRLNKQ